MIIMIQHSTYWKLFFHLIPKTEYRHQYKGKLDELIGLSPSKSVPGIHKFT